MKIDKVLTYLKTNWFFLLILSQPILDIVAFFQADNVFGSLAGYSRLILMVIIPIYILFTTKKKVSFFSIMAVIGVFSLLHIANSYRVGYISIFQDIAYLMRVIQMPVLAISFMYYMKDDRYNEMTQKAFTINLIVIFVTMVIAHITNTADWTYGVGIGLKGWFANSNSQSIILIALIPLTLYHFLNKKSWQLFIISLVIWFLLVSNGTKAAYYSCYLIFFTFIVFFIVEYFMHRKEKGKYRAFATGLFLVLIVATKLVYPYTPRYIMDNQYGSATSAKDEKIKEETSNKRVSGSLEEMKANNPEVYQELLDYYEPLLNEDIVKRFGVEKVIQQYGFFPDAYLITDIRLLKVMYADLVWQETDSLTKMVGFEYTQVCGLIEDSECFDLESDPPAIFYYYGYIGSGLYAALILFIAFMIIKRVCTHFKTTVNLYNFSLLITFGLLLGLSQYSGAILRRPNVSIYLSIIIALIYYACTKKESSETENERTIR